MSLIRAIKHRLGLSVTPANNFVLDASADNGTMKLARESGQDIMTVNAAGKVAFPQLPIQSPGSNDGTIELPGGIIIKWKRLSMTLAANTRNQFDFTWITPFPNRCFGAVISPENALSNSTVQGQMNVSSVSASGGTVSGFNSYATTITGFAIAMGI